MLDRHLTGSSLSGKNFNLIFFRFCCFILFPVYGCVRQFSTITMAKTLVAYVFQRKQPFNLLSCDVLGWCVYLRGPNSTVPIL